MNHPNRNKLSPTSLAVGDHVRQGDVLLRKVENIPKDATELKRDQHKRIVLALGEKTGHGHAIRDKNVTSYSKLDNNEIEFLIVGGSGATLKHELVSGKKAEHDAIVLPPGNYDAAQQVEYSPQEIIRVED